jgi:dUTP pyrophosphatase
MRKRIVEEIRISIRKLPGHEDIPFPRYMTEKSAGMDIFAAVVAEEVIPPGERRMIPTGITMAIPEGYEAQIRPRSGLAIKDGVTLINSPGTIDADFRGEVNLLLVNHGSRPYLVRRGDRIAQMVVHRVCRVTWEPSPALDQTSRGSGGFGHTGS